MSRVSTKRKGKSKLPKELRGLQIESLADELVDVSKESELDLRQKITAKLQDGRPNLGSVAKNEIRIKSVVALPSTPRDCDSPPHDLPRQSPAVPSKWDQDLDHYRLSRDEPADTPRSTVTVVQQNENDWTSGPSSSRARGVSRGRVYYPRSRGAGRRYTGYGFHDDRRRSPTPEQGPSCKNVGGRPSPPRDMPEHIRWLHNRWRKYDSSFFKDEDEAPPKAPIKGPTQAERDAYRQQMADFKREKRRGGTSTGANTEPLAKQRRFLEANRAASQQAGGSGTMAYHQFRRGGEYSVNIGRILTFKEFLLSQPAELEQQDEAVDAYNKYKLEYRRRSLAEFFQAHSEEEWFLEKYHPLLKRRADERAAVKTRRRLDAFMQLLVRGWVEVSLDAFDSRRVRKLVDAAIVLLEGGDEGDMACLSDLDYVLEEKREQSYDAAAAAKADKDEDSSDEEETTVADQGKAPGGGRTIEEREEDAKLPSVPTETELELMQHARDYSLYLQEHEKEVDVSEMPDNVEPVAVGRQTAYMGSGVFVSQMSNPKALEEMNLHKVAALLIRNVPPSVTREELESLCADAHGGFLRLSVGAPDPQNRHFRAAIVSYWHSANLTKICWKLRGHKLRGVPVVVIEYREFAKRIELIDGLASDKSVVLRDIQLCKSLIEYLDRRKELWAAATEAPAEGQAEAQEETPPKANPLLVNLDECLAFHLQELIEGGKAEEDGTKPAVQVDKVDRDDNLTRVLDRLILYLRLVHSVDYYGCRLLDGEDDQPRRIGSMHIRGTASKTANPKRLARYIRQFEAKLKTLLPQERRLAAEHVEVLGARTAKAEEERFTEQNVISVGDGMSKCCVCFKRFTSREFAKMHMGERHRDKLEEVKWVVLCYNSYLADPNRPCAVDIAV